MEKKNLLRYRSWPRLIVRLDRSLLHSPLMSLQRKADADADMRHSVRHTHPPHPLLSPRPPFSLPLSIVPFPLPDI